MSTADPVVVARFWTRARRFPQLIGKSINGERIWGGPYTLVQFIGGFLTAWLLWETMPLWGRGPFLAQLLMIPVITYGIVWLLGRIPVTGRNPALLLTGIGNALASPRLGRYAGRNLALSTFATNRRPRRATSNVAVWTTPIRSTTTVTHPAAASTETAPATASEPRPEQPSVPSRPRPARHRAQLTYVQELLAAAANKSSSQSRTTCADDWYAAGQRVQVTHAMTTAKPDTNSLEEQHP